MAATSSNNSSSNSISPTNNNNNHNNNNNVHIETDEFIKKSRVTRAAPPKPAYDPLQFVQIKPAKLYDPSKANKPSTERKQQEVKPPREVEDAEEWQCNLDNWKSSRRKRVEHIIDKITEAKKIEQEEVCRARKKSKTFSEMLENSCCSSKHADGDSKAADEELDEHGSAREVPEMNEFSLAIENYKSKFPMTQSTSTSATNGTSRVSAVLGSSIVTTATTSSSVVSSIESTSNDNYESNNSAGEESDVAEVERVTQKLQSTGLLVEATRREERRSTPLVTVQPMESRMQLQQEEQENQEEKQAKQQEQCQEERPKVNVIERRRLFEQLQQMAHTTTPAVADTTPSGVAKLTPPATFAGGQQERPLEETGGDGDSGTSTSEWLAAGIASIRERRAIFERYQSNEMIAEEHDQQSQQQQLLVGGRSRSSSTTTTTTVVVKSRSESNVGFVNGSTGRFELALNQLKRNGGGSSDCCEDSGIQSTTDLSRSSVVSQADENDPPSLSLLSPDEMMLMAGKSPARSTTLDSASEFSDTDCSNGQLLDNALDVAFEEMDSELNESGTVEGALSQREREPSVAQPAETDIVPLSVIPLATDYMPAAEGDALMHEEQQQQLVLMALPQSSLTPPKEKPPPPPVEEEPSEQELLQSLTTRVSVERELLQIEQEELQRRREKQMFYEKLTKADAAAAAAGTRAVTDPAQPLPPHHHYHQPQHSNQLQQQSQTVQQSPLVQSVRQAPPQQQQQPYYYPHHHSHQPSHLHHNLLHHHRASMPAIDSRSLQNVNSYASYDAPFLDEVVNSGYEMGSLHRESMPNLSHVAASSSHPSSLSSYGEEFSANSAASFDGSCWPPAVDHHRGATGHPGATLFDKRPAVAPRPAMNGSLPPGAAVGGYHGGGGQRVSNSMFEQHPKDNKQNTHPSAMVVNRGQGSSSSSGGGGGTNHMPYGQHWLVQEAEQRRIEQHQKSSTNNAKRPLPKFVIDAITQRVQKLNAASPENSDRSNLSEDSDLAMINSMKNHHHHHASMPPPPSSHHHHAHLPHQQQQPPALPALPPPQQKYSNTSDKVLSVSGKKECSHCRIELGKGAAMAIESLGLFYHIECFKCCVCHVKLGDGTNGIDVRVRKYRLHCQNCFSSEDGVKFSCV
uniref:LIM zinc-binding domain-containing protein n=1 Tax=Anopheles merus TaxID=30066 RepID=A0A182V161_ANOME